MTQHGFPVGRFDPFVIVVNWYDKPNLQTLKSWETIKLPDADVTGYGDWDKGAILRMLRDVMVLNEKIILVNENAYFRKR